MLQIEQNALKVAAWNSHALQVAARAHKSSSCWVERYNAHSQTVDMSNKGCLCDTLAVTNSYITLFEPNMQLSRVICAANPSTRVIGR